MNLTKEITINVTEYEYLMLEQAITILYPKGFVQCRYNEGKMRIMYSPDMESFKKMRERLNILIYIMQSSEKIHTFAVLDNMKEISARYLATYLISFLRNPVLTAKDCENFAKNLEDATEIVSSL